MPELPDVEGFKRHWSRFAAGRRVHEVEAKPAVIVRNASVADLRRSLRGRRLARPVRRGKWLIAPTDGDPALVLHFGMTGGLRWSARERSRHRHDRVVLILEGGEMRYRNMRMIGGVWLAQAEREIGRIVGPLGPDADALGTGDLAELLSGRRRGLKSALMDQSVVAGIGNELSDEILWQARLHPARSVGGLSTRRLEALQRTARSVIASSNRHGRIPREPHWLSSQRGRSEPTCPRCGRALRRSRIAGRTSYWCPRCQSP